MTPGPKKKSFLSPRGNKESLSNKAKELNKPKAQTSSIRKELGVDSNVDCKNSADPDQKRYSKRSVESNWNKYDESVQQPYADYNRGEDIQVMLSYSKESGSQLKLKEEKEWENGVNFKDITLNLQDLIYSLKCIPFHQRINVKEYFNNKQIENFISCAENWRKTYKHESKSLELFSKEIEQEVDSTITVIEEPNLADSDDSLVMINYDIKDHTVDIINSLTSNLTFKELSDFEKQSLEKETKTIENSELPSNDLDFLLSLNISSQDSETNNENVSITSNVDDWLNSILDS